MNLKLFTRFNWKCLSRGSEPSSLPSHYLSALIICRYFMGSDVPGCLRRLLNLFPVDYRPENTNAEDWKILAKGRLVNHVTAFAVSLIHRRRLSRLCWRKKSQIVSFASELNSSDRRPGGVLMMNLSPVELQTSFCDELTSESCYPSTGAWAVLFLIDLNKPEVPLCEPLGFTHNCSPVSCQ